MSEGDDAALMRVAGAITDGVAVQWEKEASENVSLRSRLGRLRVLEAVAEAQRLTLAGEGSTTPGVPSSRFLVETSADPEKPASIPAGPDPARHWGRLKILGPLGRGGFGEVYRAWDPVLRREVALKLVRANRTREGWPASQLIEEARRLARVRHPNVLAVHGADIHDGQVGIWMDLLEGETLEECLAERGPFGAHEAALIGIDLCRALAAVHGAGLIHRDVKTANVMREKGGRIVLMDFGAVSEASPTGDGQSRSVAGTPLTMAPEVLLRGETPRTSADIYSLGVLLYRLVSGRFPITATSLHDLADKHRRRAATPLRDARPDLPIAFVQAVERALSPEPVKRYPSAGAMEQGLLESLVSPGPGPTPAHRLPLVAALFAMTVVLAGLIVWLLWPTRPLTIDATFLRLKGQIEEPLITGSQIAVGDRLTLEIQASEPLYLYVLNEDESGEAFVLFPVSLDLANPLPPGSRHRLPGRLAGIQQYWQLTSAGGSETILAIASRTPLEVLEREMASIPRAGPGRSLEYPRLGTESKERLLRGIGRIAPLEVTPARPARLARIVDVLPDQIEAASDVWIRKIRLESRPR